MWKKEISIETTATKEQVWKIWSEVNNWNKWDEEVIRSSLNGEFKKGTKGILIPTNGPKSNFIIHSATYPIEFTTRASLPLSKMNFTHEISKQNGKTIITHGVEISGFGANSYYSTENGFFQLSFQKKSPGELVKITHKGMILKVNDSLLAVSRSRGWNQ